MEGQGDIIVNAEMVRGRTLWFLPCVVTTMIVVLVPVIIILSTEETEWISFLVSGHPILPIGSDTL